MDGLVSFLTQPLVILIAALALLAGRTILHARRLKSVAREPDLAGLLNQGEDQNHLDLHRDYLNEAKAAPAENLTSARRLLKSYKRVFDRSKPRRN